MINEEPQNKDKYQKEIDKYQQKAKDILAEMEKYAMKNKSRGIIAYAQFQSMNGRDKFLRAINKTAWCMRICTKRHDYKYLKKRWPEVAKGPEPTVIIW
jgi:t-SNARE complex subunit (syntaxin)